MSHWLGPTLTEPARLLVATASRWLPWVGGLAMVGALPEIAVQLALPDIVRSLGSLDAIASMDAEFITAAAFAVMVLLLLKLIFELAALMLAFVILADITSGRDADLWGGLRRLASWKLQFAWLFAGFMEQIAISVWFLGGGLLLVPFGMATTAAYEEDNGFASFGRSMRLGQIGNPIGHGFRIAAGVTIGFFAAFVLRTLVSTVSCAFTAGHYSTGILALLSGGQLDPSAFSVPDYGPVDIFFALILAPLTVLPTVYMMTVQQLAYWAARKDEAEGRAPRRTG
jgi:hypothetical protein